MKFEPQVLSMANTPTLRSSKTTHVIVRPALNVIILGTSKSTPSGTSALSAKSTDPDILNITALSIIIVPTHLHHPLHLPLILALFLLLVPAGWFLRMLLSAVATPTLVPLLVLLPPWKTLTMTKLPLPTWWACLSYPTLTSDSHLSYIILLCSFRCKKGVMLRSLLFFHHILIILSLLLPHLCLSFSLFPRNIFHLNAAFLFIHCVWLCITLPFLLRDYPFFSWTLSQFLCLYSLVHAQYILPI